MENNQRSHWESCLLGFLLLFTASGGMPLSKDINDWQHGKDASLKVIQTLWELGDNTVISETNWTFSFPKPIECNDSCDPDSLNGDKTPCLQKISQNLQEYHDLLSRLSEFESLSPNTEKRTEKPTIADLKSAVEELQDYLPKKKGERRTTIEPWEFGLLRNETLWRLQSFSSVVGRVFAHCAAMKLNLKA